MERSDHGTTQWCISMKISWPLTIPVYESAGAFTIRPDRSSISSFGALTVCCGVFLVSPTGLLTLAEVTAGTRHDGKGATPRVLILDPAAGTGTFLRSVVARVRGTIEAKGLGGVWPDYVRTHLLPRLFGFELMMAPYAISHMMLAREIGGANGGFTVLPNQRINVFLTDTLEEAREGVAGPGFLREIAREAKGADGIKREAPVMVILGNPPYSGESANRGKWIHDLLRGKDGDEETGSYFQVDGRKLNERNPKWINDDYVKFIRFAQWRIQRTGEGLVGFVTNHGYLYNPTFRGMRHCLMETFDEIYLLDLHGNTKRRERAPDGGQDENVFDIQQGVAIGFFIKQGEGDRCSGPSLPFRSLGRTKSWARRREIRLAVQQRC